MYWRIKNIFIIVMGLLPVNLIGQELVTDRPDFTESAIVVPSKSVQVEMGLAYEKTSDEKAYSLPNSLIRIGLNESIELRLGLPGWSVLDINGERNTFFNDLLAEVKIQVGDRHAPVPFALILVSTIPVGDDAVSSGESEFGIKLATSYDINENSGLGVNLGGIFVKDGNDRKFVTIASVSYGKSLSNRLGVFLETFAEMPQDDTWSPVLDGGFTYSVPPISQFDFYIGTGLD